MEAPAEFGKGLSKGDKSMAWATALAIWILETLFAGRKAEWKRIVVKSGKVLRGLGLELKEVTKAIEGMA